MLKERILSANHRKLKKSSSFDLSCHRNRLPTKYTKQPQKNTTQLASRMMPWDSLCVLCVFPTITKIIAN